MKRISIFLLGFILLFLLGGCTRTEPELETSKWDLAALYEGSSTPVFDIEEDGYHVTSAVKFENDIAYGLNEKEYRELTKEKIKEKFSAVSEVDFDHGTIVTSFSKGEGGRITQVFQQASFINITGKITVEKKSCSDDHQIIGMTPSGNYKYSAIIFLPKVITLNGSCCINNEEKAVKFQYPLTSEDGYLDGIFFLAESDDEQSLPD